MHVECPVSADRKAAVIRSAAGDAADEVFTPIVTTSDVVTADAAGDADGRGFSRGPLDGQADLQTQGDAKKSARDLPEQAAHDVAAFGLPPEDEMMDGELHYSGAPGEVDEDAFDFGSDLGPSAYYS